MLLLYTPSQTKEKDVNNLHSHKVGDMQTQWKTFSVWNHYSTIYTMISDNEKVQCVVHTVGYACDGVISY